MKPLNTYVVEKLKINKDFKSNLECPKNIDELKILIKERINKNPEHPDFSDIDISNIKDLSNLFELSNGYCDLSKTKIIDLSAWDTSFVEDIGGMFQRNDFVEYIDLSGWNTTNVKSILSLFYNCTNLKEIKGIEDLKFPSCEEFGNDAFFRVNEKLWPEWWYKNKEK